MVKPLICPTLLPDVLIKRVLSLIISKYLESYFFILSIRSFKALSIYSPVTTLALSICAQVAASPIIWDKSLNLVESFSWSSANLEENCITFATAVLSRGNRLSFSQKPWMKLAILFIFSKVFSDVSSNSTLILNNFLKSSSRASRVWYTCSLPSKITFKSKGIGSGFNETITILERWSAAFSKINSSIRKAFFNVS